MNDDPHKGPPHDATTAAPRAARGDDHSHQDQNQDHHNDHDSDHDRDVPGLAPLPGEPGIPDLAAPRRPAVSGKGLLAVGLLVASLVVASAMAIHRVMLSGHKSDTGSRLSRDRPAAAGAEPRRIEMPSLDASGAPQGSSSLSTPSTSPRIPALSPTDEELAEPIGVRRTGTGAGAGVESGAGAGAGTGSAAHGPSAGGPSAVSPEDAPVLLVSTRPTASANIRDTAPGSATQFSSPAPATTPDDASETLAATSRNLEAYQRQLQDLMEQLTRSADQAQGGGNAQSAPPSLQGLGPVSLGANPGAAPAGMASPAPAGLLGGQLQGSATPRASAGMLGRRSLTLPKGSSFTCALKTRAISAASGLVGCQVQRNVYGDDGRVLLIERGSHLDGEYRIAAVRAGMVRIPVLWTRLRTPLGVTVDLESPATGPLGESGIDGHVDNRWGERLGAAMLLSLIDDSVKLVIQSQANERQGDTIVLPGTTANTSKLAEKVLDSTINIPPLIYQNQGGIVGIHVARDLDFSSVYELLPSSMGSRAHQPVLDRP